MEQLCECVDAIFAGSVWYRILYVAYKHTIICIKPELPHVSITDGTTTLRPLQVAAKDESLIRGKPGNMAGFRQWH